MPSTIVLRNISVEFPRRLGAGHFKEFVRAKLASSTRPPAPEPERFGLRDLSFYFANGDRVAILGHNGAGKSTLLKVISRIYHPSEGQLEVRGRVAPLLELGTAFSGELTGRDNIFLTGSLLGIPRSVLRERLGAIVEFSGLDGHLDVPVKYYSTGMALRLAFSLATEVQPEILLLDELFAGADASFVKSIQRRLEQFIESSRILLLVSHDLNTLRHFCNRAIILERGRLLAAGGCEEMIRLYLSTQR